METYTVRVISKQGAALGRQVRFDSDREAIRWGIEAAAPGETLEVWRETEMIYLGQVGKHLPRDAVLTNFT